jgi:CheY-like chemotaxis protein
MEIPAAGRRILVVEDDPNSQAVIAAMLRKRGFEVLMADSGVAALDAFQSHAIDLILMDCQIPKLDGYETTARIRGMEGPQRRTPIIALTANALPDDRQRCLDAGMDDYLPKPVSMQAVFEALAKWPSLKLPTT